MEASCTAQKLRNFCKFFSESDKKKIGKSNLKKSGERSRAILALLFPWCSGNSTDLHKSLLESIVGKGENDGKEYFLLFS